MPHWAGVMGGRGAGIFSPAALKNSSACMGSARHEQQEALSVGPQGLILS